LTKASYAEAWHVFDIHWDKTCSYHKEQSGIIFKAYMTNIFDMPEAMAELRRIASERWECKDCELRKL